jgi:hypothetical protein
LLKSYTLHIRQFRLGDECTIPTGLVPNLPNIYDPRYGDPNLASAAGSDRGSGSDVGTIAGITIVVFLGLVICAIILYRHWQQKLRKLKSELAHVHYIADPGTQPGKSQQF